MNNKKLSIITICYNEPDVEKTCESIVNQTWQDFEWIVVDGGSNKETLDVFEKYKSKMTVFISEPDEGIYNAMNKGIKLATGEYLNFLNAGDCYTNSEVLANVVDKLNCDIVSGDLKFINPDGTSTLWKAEDKVDNRLLITGTLPHPSSFIKNELFKKYGGYNESNKIVSDWEKWIEFFKVQNCSYKHIDLLCCDFNMDGISSRNIELCNKERELVINRYFTSKEIDKALNNIKYSLFERIFSIKNGYLNRYKIITVLGLQIKIKRSK